MNNETVAHNFVYGDNGKGSNFESANGTLWSYGSVLAIKTSDWIIVSNHISNYSSTSQRHASYLNRAIGWGTFASNHTITVYHGEPQYFGKGDVVGEIKVALKAIKELLARQGRARKHSYFDAIDDRIENTQKIIKRFGVDKRSSEYKEFNKLVNTDLRENYLEMIEEFTQAEKTRAKKRIADQHKKRREKIQTLTGMTDSEIDSYTKTELANYDFIYKREREEVELCTTQSLCVDFNQAVILYRLLIGGRDIIGKKIGYYTIISHNNVSVKIGCHNILIKELGRVLG